MDLVNNTRCSCHQIQIVFSLQSLLNDFQVEQSKESTTESKSKCQRSLRLKIKCRIVELQLFQCISQIRILGAVCRIHSTVNHGIYLLVTRKRLCCRSGRIRNRITYACVFYIFQTGSEITYHSGRKLFTRNKLTCAKISYFHHISLCSRSHHLNRCPLSDTPFFNSTEYNNSSIRIIKRIKNQCLKGCIRVSCRSRHLLHNLFQHIFYI